MAVLAAALPASDLLSTTRRRRLQPTVIWARFPESARPGLYPRSQHVGRFLCFLPVMVAVALTHTAGFRPVRRTLPLAATPLLCAALIFSYSRLPFST